MMSFYPGVQVEIEAFNRTQQSALSAPVAAGATTIVVYDASRWSAGNALKIDAGDPQDGPSELAAVASIAVDGVTVTVSAALKRRHGVGTRVWRLVDATMAGVVETPDGVDTAVALSSVSTGRYRGSYTTAQSGPHEVEITASGAASAVAATAFEVLSDVV